MILRAAAAAGILSLPYWLPRAVVALRVRIFTAVNGRQGVPIPGDVVPVSRFREVYSHPAADGRSRGAALSDLFWYWLAPGSHVHQEHLEPGERYDEVARTTRGIMSMPTAEAEELAARCVARAVARLRRPSTVRLRDLMMPVWAEFFYEVVFGERCPPEARELIVAHADDVVTSLKCCGLRHMRVRDRLTCYLLGALDRVPHRLPSRLTRREQAYYLQGAFFNTGVVQQAEATAHLMMVLAAHSGVQAELAEADDRRFDHVIAETMRLYPLFGVAHRITSADIEVDEATTLPAGSVLCFNYPEFHRTGYAEPDRFDPGRWEALTARHANHIPFGMAANRPCPAWHLAPAALRGAARELLRTLSFHTSAQHTRSLPNRGPCLVTARGARPRAGELTWMRIKDRWEDVWRSPLQLVLGTYMVLDARRKGLCRRYFARTADPVKGPADNEATGRCPRP
ncbi:cytochrome P450 [Spongiactinospora gelatinilytica]|uniref:Cytochrome P450 n=1 Tax=Spongiactinospora gelatinilytica TaxID=2666298 RepID=A0A2W2H6H2_9ACTN|nr:cytochrome P450 [Spongiactinospora gelatinilytica]PZG47555.1 cytochrome P450 [Spongiactinospora gelatinilytica]